ncbi:MAG: Rhamnosyltransferase [uncultured Rubrobacteraceae bacterium]|uniref:Rhamnosyltransferase n=1 Tax=uncultured Rubrobacteraceae bacterium TaxID=349277 RepID=A0A6J4PMC0_9ACTN|nr:MAG: Rhamnosyltransferase [uncultured Rubrobacteraceae bacterium]
MTSPRPGGPEASVVVLTLNAGPDFAATLDAVFAQKTAFDFEVIVLDSGSTDGTRELARARGAIVHDVPGSTFDHGATRDLGLSLAAGEYVALLVQDAVPLDDRWLAAMIENMEGDPLVAGVYGRQLARPGSSPLARVLVTNAPTAGHERREQYAGGPGRYRKLPPAQRRALALFDNVSSCVRRSVWEEVPFGRTGFGEDLRWGERAVARSHKLVYEPRSAVVHSHERGPLYDLRRHYAEGRLLVDLFGLAPVPNLARLLRNTLLASAHLCRRLLLDEKTGWRSPLLAVRHAVPSQMGLYLATRRHTLPARLDRFLSKGV